MYEAAVRGLTPVKGPLPVKFPLPDAQDPFSLKPGSMSTNFRENKSTAVEKSSTLNAAIAGARAAATQFNKKNQDLLTNVMQDEKPYALRSGSKKKSSDGDAFNQGTSALAENGERNLIEHEESSSHDQPRGRLKQVPGAPSRVCSFSYLSIIFLIFVWLFGKTCSFEQKHTYMRLKPKKKKNWNRHGDSLTWILCGSEFNNLLVHQSI